MKIREKFLVVAVLALLITSANAGVLFEDNFDSYASLGGDVRLADVSSNWSGDWEDTARGVRVGSWWGGRAYFSNGYWGDSEVRMLEANLGQDVADVSVAAEAWVHDGGVLNWYVGGRMTDTSFVRLGALLGNADIDGNVPVYARVRDSVGGIGGDYYVGTYNAAEAIYLDLTMEGDQVVGTVSHNGQTTSIDYTTSILDAGATGFGGQYLWGYGLGDFDNFAVSTVPEPATLTLIGLGLGFVGLKRKQK